MLELPQTLKPCADCETYTPIFSLIEKPDGREVCPTCQGKIERLAVSKQQLDFFGQHRLGYVARAVLSEAVRRRGTSGNGSPIAARSSRNYHAARSAQVILKSPLKW